jgi:hypothetical protein
MLILIHKGCRSNATMDEDPPLLELSVVRDTFATGCGKVDIVGPCARFYFYAEQDSLGMGIERVVVAKIVMPIELVPAALKLAQDMLLDMQKRVH